jgi:hypothetical protein
MDQNHKQCGERFEEINIVEVCMIICLCMVLVPDNIDNIARSNMTRKIKIEELLIITN